MSDTALPRGELGNITITLSGEPLSVTGWTGLQIIRGIDQAADAFSFSFPYEPTDENRQRFVDYRTSTIQIKYDTEVIVTGIAEKYERSVSANGITMTINGRSRSGSLLELSAGPPFQVAGTFNAMADQIIPDGLDVAGNRLNRAFVTVRAIPDFIADEADGIIFTIEPGQTIWEVLSKIAAGRNLYAFPQPDGGVIFRNITIPAPVADITEGVTPVISIDTTTDITKRFYEYFVTNTNNGEISIYSEIDRGVAQDARARTLIQTDQPGNIEQAAKFARAKGIMESFTCSLSVAGWTVNGTLWAPGMTITILYPSAGIFNRSKLMVRRATMQLDENGGALTNLELTFPEVFAGGQPVAPYPWSLT